MSSLGEMPVPPEVMIRSTPSATASRSARPTGSRRELPAAVHLKTLAVQAIQR
ncbi:hypothetical protein I552_1882 [Mycobacterium xenopi 3993]|nr:hypothetical protein I552_1882 [Mycobacterium xenopi 3993]